MRLLLIISLLFSALNSYAQSAAIDTLEVKNYRFPVIELEDAAVAEKINQSLVKEVLLPILENAPAENATAASLLQTIFDEALLTSNPELAEYSGIDYHLTYHDNGLLSLMLTVEYMGAYPSQHIEYLNFDLSDGRLLTKEDFLAANQIKPFQKELGKFVTRRIKERAKEVASDFGDTPKAFISTVNEAIDPDYLKRFQITTKGVIFYVDYGLPHALKALEPENDYLFLYKNLKPFLDSEGVLKFVF
ncbi:hypothetical protein [Thioflexithrix psekupsensis]|uniref:DUF3298 domain-containing protein n=1 Tax=Thioflexithrix psekupsensis TaxID=1570016 RepID=A0A251X4M4_9GAMM|nr:hypothetical protein [Thioflexithrix psekupsensis]OUD12346.1 hypothetical protein TPSD3_14635 [Thioflexithrix psekupsensis]